MEFKPLFDILKKHLSDGANTPEFFRELVAMCTDVTEDEMGTEKDPSAKLTDGTIQTYTKRGISRKFAKSIVYRLSSDILIERINECTDDNRQLLADDLRGYAPDVDAENVGSTVAQMMVNIIQKAAGLIPQDELMKQQQQQAAIELKSRLGEYLRNEANSFCPFPGCGRALTFAKDERVSNSYDVSVIDRAKPANPDNLLAMCPRCHATYLLDDDKKICKDLKSIKAVLSAHAQSIRLLDDLPLETGIVRVIRKISKLKEKDLSGAVMNPKEIAQKLKPDDDIALYMTVRNYVLTYFVRIKEIMMNLDKRSEINYEEVQDQMHAIYRRLKKARKTNVEIFDEITNKVQRNSLQPEIYCQIVVAYFVQSCEVFDATAQ